MEVEINDDNFEQEVLKANLPVLVDFWAEWCMPCKVVAPVVGEIAKDYEGKLKVCKLNVDQGPNTAGKYGIMSIPTLAIFKEGQLVDSVVGALPKETIVERIEPHISE